ncbi:hypothetical protein [Nannocystis punicea]|uniref:Uncharacterized protein n=1 Tax=Nannocystis punicea TaxID=2995304 RepID=A0ABY7GXH5_9BACT|nr:hypothetical protein [Nannocystis poenicansa]WAS91677.1 hypothetical protein O0S08_36310 [Nannocystis poenicansa]
MQPSLLKRLESLFRDLMDAAELRRFISNLFGRQITSQLPGECSHELLAHGTVTVLELNDLIDNELFVELVSERPSMRPHIQAVAQEFGFAAVPCIGPDGAIVHSVRTPDYVVRDTYENLRRQSAVLRTLTHGEVHLSRLLGHALRQNDEEFAALPGRVVAWIDAHRHEITLTELKVPLEAAYLAASAFAANPQGALLGSLAAVILGGDRMIHAIQQLVGFASLSEQELYKLALKMVESGR